MANRHSNKKLRAEIRAVTEATGESYQAARHRILSRARDETSTKAHFIRTRCFGVALTYATWEQYGRIWTMLVPGGGGNSPQRLQGLSQEELRRFGTSPRPVFGRLQ